MQLIPGFRIGTIPVLGTTPALFGMAAAAHVLCQLARQPLRGETIFGMRAPQYETALDRLKEREEVAYGSDAGVIIDIDDVRTPKP